MEKWIFLGLSGLAIFFNIQFAQWLGLLSSYSEGKFEKFLGLNGGRELPPESRGPGSRLVIADGLNFVALLFVGSLVISGYLIVNTLKAFSLWFD